jgi:hypothetical protein
MSRVQVSLRWQKAHLRVLPWEKFRSLTILTQELGQIKLLWMQIHSRGVSIANPSTRLRYEDFCLPPRVLADHLIQCY